jgi:RNA polymerase sigma-70 factor (ECF subfamily)
VLLFSRKRKARDAFEAEVLPLVDRLYGFGVYLSGDRREAEDLVQDTLVKAYRAFDRFEPGTNLRAWLYTILANTYKNRLRRRDQGWTSLDDLSPAGEAETAWSEGSIDPEVAADDLSVQERVRAAIDKLPPDFRAVVLLADLEGYAYREIADILGVPIGTVMSRLHRGRQALKRHLAGLAAEVVPHLVGADVEECR